MAVIRLTPSLCTGVSRCWSIEHNSQRVRKSLRLFRALGHAVPNEMGNCPLYRSAATMGLYSRPPPAQQPRPHVLPGQKRSKDQSSSETERPVRAIHQHRFGELTIDSERVVGFNEKPQVSEGQTGSNLHRRRSRGRDGRSSEGGGDLWRGRRSLGVGWSHDCC
jgi:hypothetical protein